MTLPTAAPPARPVRSHLAAWLFAWIAVIVYVSLHPWSGWRVPGVPLLAFLSEPWPRYWTRLDLMMNLVAYLPLGLLGATWLARRLPTCAAALATMVGAGLLSCSLEALQTLLPARVSSLPDLLLNVAGAFIGALLRWRLPGHGDIPPAQFIPLAEESNLILGIG
ncbi:MAG TPA: VanZ family protein, partial [Burkholderiaceae bacterium]|nr:VanZ family protein [Burkholderiaceae bacterium]